MSLKWTNRRIALLATVLAGLAAVAVVAGQSLASAGSHQAARASSVIVDGTTDTVVNIDPANEYDYGSFTVDLLIFQGLYGFPNGAKLQPVLSTGCKASANLKTWTCGLSKNVKFSDGNPMTSADVKYSFDRVLKIKGDQGIYTLLSNLKSTTTSGPYTVVFHLKSPQSTWPLILSTNAGYVVEKSKYPVNKILANTDTAVIGTGPYELTKFTPGQQAVFTPNPNYWGTKPKNGGLIINYYSKSSTMKLALQKGEIDMAFRDFTPTEISSLAKTKGIVVHSGQRRGHPLPRLQREAATVQQPRGPEGDRVPDAAADHRDARLPRHRASRSTRWSRRACRARPTPTRRSTAPAAQRRRRRRVLKAAGVTTPVPITLWWTPSHYGDASADEYTEIQRALNASGLFKVTLKSAEWAQYSGALGKTYGAFQLGWFPDYPDADDYTVSFYQRGAFYNNGYCDPTMTKLIAKERAARTEARPDRHLKAMQLLAAKDLPTIPYWQGKMIAVSRSERPGHQQHAGRRVLHAVLEALEVLDPYAVQEGRPPGAPPAHLQLSSLRARHLAPHLPADAARARRADGADPADARLPADAGGAREPDLGGARRPRPAGRDQPDHAPARLRQAAVDAVRRLPLGHRARQLRHDDHRHRPLTPDHRENGAATLELTFFAMLVAIVVGVVVGLVAGRFRDTPLDVGGRLFGIVIYATPGLLPRPAGAARVRRLARLAADLRPGEPDHPGAPADAHEHPLHRRDHRPQLGCALGRDRGT